MALALLSALGAPSAATCDDRRITRGRVLPIGGVKEKVLGAHRAGIPEILLPRENEADLEDLDPSVRRSLSFHLVETLDEAIAVAMRAA